MAVQFKQRGGAKAAKAARLVFEERVHDAEGARVFVVDGDTDRYLVTLLPIEYQSPTGKQIPRESCTCAFGRTAKPEQGSCSHIMAARAQVELEKSADPFAGLPR